MLACRLFFFWWAEQEMISENSILFGFSFPEKRELLLKSNCIYDSLVRELMTLKDF